MKRVVYGLGLTLIFASISLAQKSVNTSASAAASQTTSSNMGFASGTQVSGQLQNSLDVQKAKVGDQVLLKTTRAIKQNGQTVIAKGSMLKGHVTDVARRTKDNATSRIGVVFDRLQQGQNQIPITAFITSVLQVNAAASMGDDTQGSSYASASSQGSASASSSASSGGLLSGVGNTVGGVTNTAGNVVNNTTQTVGNVANTTGQVVGNTTSAVAGSVKGLTISNSTSASAQGGSTLSMTGSNLRLASGTTFNLSVSSSASADVH